MAAVRPPVSTQRSHSAEPSLLTRPLDHQTTTPLSEVCESVLSTEDAYLRIRTVPQPDDRLGAFKGFLSKKNERCIELPPKHAAKNAWSSHETHNDFNRPFLLVAVNLCLMACDSGNDGDSTNTSNASGTQPERNRRPGQYSRCCEQCRQGCAGGTQTVAGKPMTGGDLGSAIATQLRRATASADASGR